MQPSRERGIHLRLGLPWPGQWRDPPGGELSEVLYCKQLARMPGNARCTSFASYVTLERMPRPEKVLYASFLRLLRRFRRDHIPLTGVVGSSVVVNPGRPINELKRLFREPQDMSLHSEWLGPTCAHVSCAPQQMIDAPVLLQPCRWAKAAGNLAITVADPCVF